MSKYKPPSSSVQYVKDDPAKRHVKKIDWLISQGKSDAQICEILEISGEVNLNLDEVSWAESDIQDIRNSFNLGKLNSDEEKSMLKFPVLRPFPAIH